MKSRANTRWNIEGDDAYIDGIGAGMIKDITLIETLGEHISDHVDAGIMAIGSDILTIPSGIIEETKQYHEIMLDQAAGGYSQNTVFMIEEWVGATQLRLITADTLEAMNPTGVVTDIDFSLYYLRSSRSDKNGMRAKIRMMEGDNVSAWNEEQQTGDRPNARGTDVDVDFSNIKGMTLADHAWCRNNVTQEVSIMPKLSGSDAITVGASADVSFANGHCLPEHVNSFMFIEGKEYRVSVVTDPKNITLDGFSGAGAGSVAWVLHSKYKAIPTGGYNHSTAVNETGIPISDSGAFDEIKYRSTAGALIHSRTGVGIYDTSRNEVWLRAAGNAPVGMTDLGSDLDTGNFLCARIMTGDAKTEDGTLYELEVEESGSAATVGDGERRIVGLSNILERYEGDWIALNKCDTNGNVGIFRIESVDVDNGYVYITDDNPNFVADANAGSIEWSIIAYERGHAIDFYWPQRQRLDLMDENWTRTIMRTGAVVDAETSLGLANLLDFVGAKNGAPGPDTDVDDPDWNNEGLYYPLSRGPNNNLKSAIQLLNDQHGDPTYTGDALDILASGDDHSTSFQKIATFVAERLPKGYYEYSFPAAVATNVLITLPYDLSYTVNREEEQPCKNLGITIESGHLHADSPLIQRDFDQVGAHGTTSTQIKVHNGVGKKENMFIIPRN